MKTLGGLALHNLQQARARTLLTAASVALGVATITATGVFKTGVQAAWSGGENKMAFITYFTDILFVGVGGMILLAAGFLIFNAFAMTVTQRQVQIGMLRALGMTRRQVLRLVLLEALGTGGLGTLLGLLLGRPLGQGVLLGLQQVGVESGQGSLRLQDVALGIIMGLGITLLASLTPARRAARVPPLAALSEAAGGAALASAPPLRLRGRALWGLILSGLLWVGMLISPPGVTSGYHTPLDIAWMLGAWFIWLFTVILLAPLLLSLAVAGLKRLLYTRGGIGGRLAVDNLQRSPGRLELTALSFMIGVGVLIGTGGLISFMNDVLVKTVAESALREAGWYIYSFDRSVGVAQMSSFSGDAPALEGAVIAATRQIAAGRAEVGEMSLATVPEISSPIPGFPSFLMNVSEAERFGHPSVFILNEGDRKVIASLLQQPGCAVTISPTTAAKFGAHPGDMITVTGRQGDVDCLVAGIGIAGITPVSWIGPGGHDLFLPTERNPDSLTVRPYVGTDLAALEADLRTLPELFPGKAYLSTGEMEVRSITDTSDQLMVVFNGMVFLGIVAAAFGMLNTILVSVLERQRELGLLRAVGATRGQLIRMLVFESALTALLGALLGALTGLGVAALSPLTYGGATFALADLDLRWAAGFVLWPAFRNGWWSLLVAPLLAALAAYPVARAALRGSAVEALEPERR